MPSDIDKLQFAIVWSTSKTCHFIAPIEIFGGDLKGNQPTKTLYLSAKRTEHLRIETYEQIVEGELPVKDGMLRLLFTERRADLLIEQEKPRVSIGTFSAWAKSSQKDPGVLFQFPIYASRFHHTLKATIAFKRNSTKKILSETRSLSLRNHRFENDKPILIPHDAIRVQISFALTSWPIANYTGWSDNQTEKNYEEGHWLSPPFYIEHTTAYDLELL